MSGAQRGEDGKQHGIGVFKTAKGDFRRGEWKAWHSHTLHVAVRMAIEFVGSQRPGLEGTDAGGQAYREDGNQPGAAEACPATDLIALLALRFGPLKA